MFRVFLVGLFEYDCDTSVCRFQVNKKMVELESTRARLKVMERNQPTAAQLLAAKPEGQQAAKPPRGTAAATGKKQQDAVGDDNYVRYGQGQQTRGENRVHFDLADKKAAAGRRASSTEQPPPARGQTLPQDARQRLEEMAQSGRASAGAVSSAVRKYSVGSASAAAGGTAAGSRGRLGGSAGALNNGAAADPVQELIASRFNYPARPNF